MAAPATRAPQGLAVDQCREVLTRVRRTALNRGASLSLTYLLVRLWQSLRRIEALAAVLGAQFRPEASAGASAGTSGASSAYSRFFLPPRPAPAAPA